jgi:pimeloyl-ACP methyl ester carboxylesterase
MKPRLLTSLLLLNACAARYDEEVCGFQFDASQMVNETVRCGELVVKETRDGKRDTTIRLGMAVFKHGAMSEVQAPVFRLTGGPSQTWRDLGVDHMKAEDTQKAWDTVLLEQRGSALSTPLLRCNMGGERGAHDLGAAQACLDRFTAGGVDLPSYNVEEMAGDIEDARIALGYDKIVLDGVSYGTLWALTYLRRHPDHVAAIILDSVVSPQHAFLDGKAETFMKAWQAMVAAADPMGSYIEAETKYLADAWRKRTEQIVDICAIWPKAAPASDRYSAVTSGVPALILSGDFDPLTPRLWADEVAASLSNAKLVKFRSLGHSVTSFPCGADVRTTFLTSGYNLPSVPSCASEELKF